MDTFQCRSISTTYPQQHIFVRSHVFVFNTNHPYLTHREHGSRNPCKCAFRTCGSRHGTVNTCNNFNAFAHHVRLTDEDRLQVCTGNMLGERGLSASPCRSATFRFTQLLSFITIYQFSPEYIEGPSGQYTEYFHGTVFRAAAGDVWCLVCEQNRLKVDCKPMFRSWKRPPFKA